MLGLVLIRRDMAGAASWVVGTKCSVECGHGRRVRIGVTRSGDYWLEWCEVKAWDRRDYYWQACLGFYAWVSRGRRGGLRFVRSRSGINWRGRLRWPSQE